MRPVHLDRLFQRGRRWRVALVGIVAVLLAIAALDVLIDAPLRRTIERTMNQRLRGYAVTLREADFRPWSLSLALADLTVVQSAHPSPPVAHLPRVVFSVHWTSLLSGRIVGDASLKAPQLHVNIRQLRQERTDDVELDERGWQAALAAAYPLKINELRVAGGTLVYVHDDPGRPLEISEIELAADNIRNIRSAERTYPSPIHGRGRVFGGGHASLDGNADFLAEPFAGVLAKLRLEGVPLERLGPLSEDVRLLIRGGQLSADGEFEISPRHREVHLAEVRIEGMRIDYLFDQQLTERALAAARQAQSHPTVAYQLDVLRLIDAELGFVNRDPEPDYRLFVSGADVRLTNLDNSRRRTSELRVEGSFMNSGSAVVAGRFRPDARGADFDLGVAIRGTELATMNDFLRAYAHLDVTGGSFSLYAELAAADGKLDGYLKPLFQDVDVYDADQERHDGFFRRIYEGIAEGLSELLENRPREEVATVAELQGTLGEPDASNLQVVVNLIRNAFFEAILPGFEAQADAPRRARGGDEPPG